MSTTTRLYGHFAYSTIQRLMPVPAPANALLERRGVDAIYVPLQVGPLQPLTPENSTVRFLDSLRSRYTSTSTATSSGSRCPLPSPWLASGAATK